MAGLTGCGRDTAYPSRFYQKKEERRDDRKEKEENEQIYAGSL